MQTKAKSNSVITHKVADDGTITFVVKDAGELALDPAKVSEANRARFLRHGIVQRVADAAAQSRDTTTGKPAPASDKLTAMKRLVDHYMTGSDEWSPARVASEGPGLDGIALAAVSEAIGKTLDDVRAMVAAGAEKKAVTQRVYLTALTTADRVRPVYERMTKARAPAIDADAELDEATKG
jgi:hypothetical protein